MNAATKGNAMTRTFTADTIEAAILEAVDAPTPIEELRAAVESMTRTEIEIARGRSDRHAAALPRLFAAAGAGLDDDSSR